MFATMCNKRSPDAITTTAGLLLGDIQPGQFSSADAGGANYQYNAIGQLILNTIFMVHRV